MKKFLIAILILMMAGQAWGQMSLLNLMPRILPQKLCTKRETIQTVPTLQDGRQQRIWRMPVLRQEQAGYSVFVLGHIQVRCCDDRIYDT